MTSPSASAAAASGATLAALEAAAYVENVAVYGYSVAGVHLDTSQRAVARADYDVHRAQLLVVEKWLQERSAIASPAVPEYEFPSPVTDSTSAQQLLANLEEAAAAAYADLVAATTGSLQRSAGLALQGAAQREARWRGSTVAFPGLTGRLPGS
jgi:hypothetical protein